MKLQRIFYEWVALQILQNDNEREFVTLRIKELVCLFNYTTIINGRPRYPQSQGSIKRANGDVKNMIRCWMVENYSTAI